MLLPTFNEIDPEAEPDVTAVPLTVIVALAWLRVGVTVMLVVALVAEAVYEVVAEAKVGERVPDDRVSEDKVASVESAVHTGYKVVADSVV